MERRANSNSYLIEITRDILAFKDTDGQPLVDKILDTAGQKGTGKWTVHLVAGTGHSDHADRRGGLCALRFRAERRARRRREKIEGTETLPIKGDRAKNSSKTFAHALYASKIVSYAQGYMLMRAAAKEYKWNLNYGGIALMWRGGCIIRSMFLGKIKEAFDKQREAVEPDARRFFPESHEKLQRSWRNVVAAACKKGIPRAGVQHRAGVLRRLSQRAVAGELLQAQTGLFRRAHLRAHRQTARRILPHQLDRPRRRRCFRKLHRLAIHPERGRGLEAANSKVPPNFVHEHLTDRRVCVKKY